MSKLPIVCLLLRIFPTVVMSRRDEQLIKEGDDEVEDDKYSIAVVDNPIYDVDPDAKPGAGVVSYYKSGQDSDDEEEEVKVNEYVATVLPGKDRIRVNNQINTL